MHYDKINVPADGEQITVNLDGTIVLRHMDD
jgi:hypothetical protein